MKKIMLGTCIVLGALLVFLYKVGEDMMSMHRCGCSYRIHDGGSRHG